MNGMRNAFTLIEMLIATAIFAVVAVAFVGILYVVTKVQVNSSSSAIVDQESQFLSQKLQYYIQAASLINIPTSTPTSTLTLYMASSSLDPTVITLASGTVYLEQPAGGLMQALTSNNVSVSNLSFTLYANPPAHDAVGISYSMALASSTSNIAQAFSQLFQDSIVQVSAASFDTGVYPTSETGEPLGNSTYQWSSINGLINFSSNNVGIGTLSPQQPLEVNGGLRLYPNGVSEPSCNSSTPSTRGTLWFQTGGSGQDNLYLCAQNSSGTLSWETVTL